MVDSHAPFEILAKGALRRYCRSDVLKLAEHRATWRQEGVNYPSAMSTTMARFFLHLHDHDELEGSHEAREFPDVFAAIAVATEELRDLLADQVRHGYLDTGLRINIRDEQGRSVAAVDLSEAVKLRD